MEIFKVNQRSKKLGRLRLKWMEVVKNDLRELKVKTWRLKANSREEWASVEKKAKFLEEGRTREHCNVTRYVRALMFELHKNIRFGYKYMCSASSVFFHRIM
jgi:hypothetical protein